MFNILHLIPSLEGGGAERQLAILAGEQSRRGWQVNVGIRRGGVHENGLRGSGAAVHWLGDHRGMNPLLLGKISRLIKKTRPDVVQTWMPQMDIIGGIAALRHALPWVVSERNSQHDYEQLRFDTWGRQRVAKHASAVVANSSGGAAYWRNISSGSTPVFQIANAVDVAAIRRVAGAGRAHVRKRHGRPEILVVGRLAPQKATEIIIPAISKLAAYLDVHVSIIGEGPLRQTLEKSISEAGLSERIALLPYQADWWKLLPEACALVSMSRYEGHPNVVLETMAAGCPLIVSDIPAHREFLDEKSALFVPPNRPAALAAALLALLTDPDAAGQRAERAAACVDRLTIESAADAYAAVYNTVIARGQQ